MDNLVSFPCWQFLLRSCPKVHAYVLNLFLSCLVLSQKLVFCSMFRLNLLERLWLVR